MIIGPGTTVTATYNDVASGSLYFNGSSSFLVYNDNTAFNLSADFTIEAWVYPINNTISSMIISKGGGLNIAWASYELFYQGGSYITFAASSNNTRYDIGAESGSTSSLGVPVLNSWNHIVVTRQQNTYRGFLNGVLGFTISSSLTPYISTGRGLQVGGAYQTTWGSASVQSRFIGSISNVRIVNGTAVYTGNFTPPLPGTLTDPVDPYLSNVSLLLTGDGTNGSTTFTDLSTINNSITNTGAVSVDTSVVKYGTGALKFSGTAAYLSIPANNALSFGTSDFTIEMWFYSTSFAAQRALITSQGYFVNGKTGSWTLRVTSATSICFVGYNSKTLLSATYEFAVSTMTVNTWYHIAVVRSSGTIKIYLNGTASATTTSIAGALSDGSSSGVWIGQNLYDSTWIGNLDDIRITAGYARYTANFTPPTGAFKQTVLLLNATSSATALTDSSYSKNTVFNNSGVVWKLSPALPTSYNYKSLTFSGTNYLTLVDSTPLTLSGGAFTIEGWVNPTGNYPSTAANILIGKRLLVSPYTGSYLVYLTATTGNLSFWNGAAYNSTTALISNQWNHFAGVYDGTNLSLFLNGVRVLGPTAVSITNVVGAPIVIGSDYNGVAEPFYGSLNNIRIVKGTALYSGATYIIPNFPLLSIANTSLLLNATTSSSYVIDSSPYNATVTNVGSVVPNFNAPAITSSYLGSLYCNGSSYLTTPSNANTALQSNNFTIECWVNFTNYNANVFGIIYSNFNSTFAANCIFFGKHTTYSGYVAVWFGSYSTSVALLVETSYPPAGWNHYALVRNGNTFTLYRNGVASVSATPTAFAATGATNIDYISGGAGVSGGLLGNITNFRIVNGTAVYTSNFTPPTQPLTAIPNTALLLNAFTSQSLLVDSSKNNATLTNTGGVRFSPNSPLSATPPPYAGSLTFSGSSYLTLADSTPLTLSGGAFTIEGWVNPSGNYPAATASILIGKRLLVSPYTSYWVVYLTSTTGNLSFYNGTIYQSTTTPISNQWNHFAAVYDGATLSLFLNGVRVLGPTAVSITNVVGAPIVIGSDYINGVAEPFYGSLINIRIVKGTALYLGPSYIIPNFPLLSIANTSLLLNATTSATALTDSSPYNATVTNVGNVFWSQNSVAPNYLPFSLTSTFNNRASLYISANSYVSYPDNVQFNPSGMFTIECWWRPDAVGTTNYEILTKGAGLQIYLLQTSSLMYVALSSSNNSTYFMNSGGGPAFVVGNWYHIALVRNSSGVNTLYVNGTQVGTPAAGLMNTGTSPFYIGCYGGNTNFSPGYYSNVRFVNGTAVYTSNFVPPTSPLTAIPGTALLTAVNTNGTADASGNNFTPTISGTVSVSTTVVPF